MDKSNEILFNESALHSLKRAQLVALCKRYDIKQNGKNEELVSRLQIYAQSLLDKQKQTLNKTSTDYVTTLNDVEGAHDSHEKPRESQQWELVEEAAEEDVVMNNSRSRTISMKSAMSIGTLKSISSAKEFAMGSVSSKGSGSVSSSLMSIATSLKRAGSKSSKMSTSTSRSTSTTDSIVKQPMAHLFPSVPTNIPTGPERTSLKATPDNVIAEPATVPLPLEDPLQEDLGRPIAHGVVDATKLQKDQSTIRLVTPAAARIRANASQAAIFATPRLKPFNMNQPKAMDDPKEHIGSAFLALDDGNEDIGNTFLAMDGRSFTETVQSDADISTATASIGEATMQPILQEATVASPTPKRSNTRSSGKGALLTISPPPQFIFGSPANAVTNDQFGNAAAVVLEEMNKRLGLTSDSTAAVRLGVDGTIDFGELTPSGKSTLNFAGKKVDDKRFGRAHEKVFGQMESITTHYAARRPPSPVKTGTLVGTKRKSTTAFDEDNNSSRNGASRRVICLDDPKDKTNAPPPPKRQRVDGADLAKMEKATLPTVTVKENEAALKKAARSRRSSKGRTSTGVSAARRRSVAPVKVAPSGRFGLLRSGAAKVMKTILSTVSSTAAPAAKVSQSSERPSRAPVVKKSSDVPVDDPSPSTSSIAPKAQVKKPLAPVAARPSTFTPRVASATTIATSRKASQSTTNSTRTSLAPKGASAAAVIRGPKPTLQRGSLPTFEAPTPASKRPSSVVVAPVVAKRASVASRTSVATSTTASRRPSSTKATPLGPVAGSQSRRPSRSGVATTASIASKLTLDSVQERSAGKAPSRRDPDFEPALPSSVPANEDESRPPSPLPAPPASLSSRPLQRRQPLESVQPDTADEKGSLGRRPRISRSKVIAKVHANRLGNGAAGSVGSSMTSASKGRKSGGASMSAKAKLMGGEGGAKARASVAAEAAKRKARVSGAAGARRRTMAVQQAAARV